METLDNQDILWQGVGEVNARFKKQATNESRECPIAICASRSVRRKLNVYYYDGQYWKSIRKIKETCGFIRDLGRVENGEWVEINPHAAKLFDKVVEQDWP